MGPHSPSAFRANTNPMSTSPRQHQSSSNGGERGATLPPPLMRSPSSFQRNMPTSADLQGSALNTDEEPNSRSDPISSSNREEEEEEGRRTPHTMSRRPSMLEDDVCFPMNSGGENDEGLDGRMRSMEEDYMHHHYHHEGHHEMEHLPQDLPPGYPFTFDLQALEDFASEERERNNGTNGPSSAAPGLRNRHSYGPNSTSMTFDSTGRKDSTGRSTAMAGNENASGINNFSAYGVSPDSDDAQFYSRRPRKFSHSAAARKAADSGAPGGSSRYQRKLALFEGAGTSPPPPVGSAARGNIMGTGALLDAERREVQSKGNLVDASTPLLGDKDINGNGGGGLPSYDGTTTTSRSMPGGGNGMGFGGGDLEDDETPIKASSRPPRSYSQGAFSAGGRARPPHQGMGNNSGPNYGFGFTHQVQPYRFTFYSNALPSTIHARNLAELPAPGQTFEELFSGRSPITRSTNTPAPNDQTTLAPEDEVKRNSAENSSPSTSRPVSRVNTIASGKGSNPTSGTGNLAAALRSVSAGSTMAPPPGRVEGTTAPPTGANTPVMGQDFSNSPFISQLPKANAALTGVNVKAATHANAQQHGLTPVTAAAFQQQQQQQAQAAAAAAGSGGPGDMRSHPNGRSLPGGGIRMDQGPEANTWWLDVLSPTDQEMKLLSRVFGIHPLTTEDILMEETREKIELFRNYYLVCFRSFDQDPYSPTYLEPLNMYIIVFREGTLSFHFRNTPHPQNVRRRIKQLKDYINVTSDWISYALIDDITDAFGPLIQGIEYEVDSIDELVLILKDAEQSDMLRRIGTCRKKVMGLLRLMGNKADVVKGLSKRCNENWSVAPKSDIGLYLSDIQDHLITMTQNLNHYEKILSRSHSNYLAQISIEMTDANNQINDVLSKLTALGTIIVPMNVITGLWGMNVNVPGQGVENLRWFGSIVAGELTKRFRMKDERTT